MHATHLMSMDPYRRLNTLIKHCFNGEYNVWEHYGGRASETEKRKKIGENGQLFSIFSPEAPNGTTGTQFRKLRGKIP